MRYLNFLFVIELVCDAETNSNVFYLRTQDGRILDCRSTCDFTETLHDFVEKLGKSKDVHEL